jgi:ketosteroid isomerase-like protein
MKGRVEMSSIAELEKRIQVLEDIEAIKRLKFDYWKYLDAKDWTAYGNVFTEDVVYDFPAFDSHAEGRQAMVDNVANFLFDYVKTCHQGHQHTIEITSDSTATGTWVLRDNLVNTKNNSEFKGRAYYDEEYRKVGGKWLISRMILKYNMAEGAVLKKFGREIAPAMGVLS